jgi:cytochrome oxidase Cu insertion factor (SCO1/SenC/PrrC family)
MARMRISACLPMLLLATTALAADPPLTEDMFRKAMKIAPEVRMAYRDASCKAVNFDAFAEGMHAPGAHADVDRAADGTALTMTVVTGRGATCPAAYPLITQMPQFDLPDLNGRHISSRNLAGKPTLMSFFFSTCKPCILEVEPLNRYAASRRDMNFVAVTFDEAEEARAFARRYGLKWNVVPDAREFVDRVRVKQYPTLALFDANGRLLGMKKGGASDALEAANVEPQVKRWVEGLLRK